MLQIEGENMKQQDKKKAKTKMLTFRISEPGYARVIKEAKKLGITKTELILSRLFPEPQPTGKIKRPYPFQKL